MVGKHSNLRRISGNLRNRDSVRLNIPTTRLSLIYVRWFVTATRLMSRSSNLSSESYDSNRSSQKSLLVCCIARVNFSLPLLRALRVSRNGKTETMILIDQSYLYATIRVNVVKILLFIKYLCEYIRITFPGFSQRRKKTLPIIIQR